MEFIALAPLAVGALRVRTDVSTSITIVVKATFRLVPGGMATLVEPLPLIRDVHYEGNTGRSLLLASDFAPRKTAADVLFTGSAYAPIGRQVLRQHVRLSIEGREGPLFDKQILVLGDRRRNAVTGAVSQPAPFVNMPLRWELAFGGPSYRLNPLGVGVVNDGERQPNLVHPGDARSAIGFSAIPGPFWLRARALRGSDPRSLDVEPMYVPSVVGAEYFNVAPEDQRVRALEGDETIVLSGLHPAIAEVRTRLPGLRAHAILDVIGRRPEVVPLVADTLWIEGDSLRCTLTWRGEVLVDDSVLAPEWAAQARARVLATLSPGAIAPTWGTAIASMRPPEPTEIKTTQVDPARPSTPVIAPPRKVPPRTQRISLKDAAGDSAPPAPPLVPPSAPPMAAPPMPMPPVPPPPPIVPERRFGVAVAKPKFLTQPPTPRSEPQVAPPSVAPESTVTPSVPENTVAHFVVPERITEGVPIVNATAMQAFTFPFQLRPPQDARIVVVKATFSLVADDVAILAPKQALPSGDVHHDDEESASLRYASDFVPFKPKADVLLTGNAYPGTQPGIGVVSLRFGALERRVAVFGDRQWQSFGSSAPSAFTQIPLRFERALGGPLSSKNPVGVGFRTGVMLPNLEDADHLVTSASDDATPGATGPTSAAWAPRNGMLGTYDAKWRKTRWPWMPEDFDWAFFNAAPSAQQIAYPAGDESFELGGVLASGERLRGRLACIAPRVLVQRTAEAGAGLFEVVLRLDTVAFDADARTVTLVFRGMFDVSDHDAPEVACVFIDRDTVPPVRSLDDMRARLDAELVVRKLVPEPNARGARASDMAMNDSDAAGYSLPANLKAIAAIEELSAERAPSEAPPDAKKPRTPRISREALVAMLARGEALAGRDLTFADLSDLDLRAHDLSEVVLKGGSLRNARLDGASLQGATLADVDARGASFVSADLREADFTDADLEGANLTGAKVATARFAKARCGGARFVEAHGEKTSFVGASLGAARFDQAKLQRADFVRANFDDASFVGANLENALFYSARGERVVFDEARLVTFRADKATLPGASLRAVDATDSSFEAADLRDAVFERATLDQANFVRTKLMGARFNQASVIEGRFRKACLAGASLLRSNLMKASFEGADLEGADLRGANLYQAETWRAKLQGVQLDLAFVAGSKLE